MGLAEVKRTSWRVRQVRNLEQGLGLYMCCWGPCNWWWLRWDYRWNDRRLKSHQLESERTVNYFVKKERICFCIHQTGPCNIVSIRNRSTYLKKETNQRTNQPKKTTQLTWLARSAATLVQPLVNHSYLFNYHARNQSSQLWKCTLFIDRISRCEIIVSIDDLGCVCCTECFC